jgi:hypothetical protein
MNFAKTSEGRQFLRASSYRSVVRAAPENVKKLDIYLPELRRLLAAGSGG